MENQGATQFPKIFGEPSTNSYHMEKMRYITLRLAVVFGLIMFSAPVFARPAVPGDAAVLYSGFIDPSSEYGPRTWWHWLNENVTTYGITRDLEAMKAMGCKGAHVVNLPQGGPAWTFGDDVIGSPVWMDKVEHAAKECERLGLELSIGSCAGWVAGGPWITPDHIVYSKAFPYMGSLTEVGAEAYEAERSYAPRVVVSGECVYGIGSS